MTIHIALTGGPCAGKTSALPILRDTLTNLGYEVVIIPEAATLLFLHGFWDNDPLGFNKKIALTMKTLEQVAGDSDKKVILWDRCYNDIKAYCKEDQEWQAVCDTVNVTIPDAVFHLRTSALEGFYTTENNAARKETKQEAIDMDKRTELAWIGHPHFRVIPNKANFQKKMDALVEAVTSFLGVPIHYEIEKKWLVKNKITQNEVLDLLTKNGISFVTNYIEQHYLISTPGISERVRKQETLGQLRYTHTTKQKTSQGLNEKERIIDEKEYYSLLNERRSLDHDPIKKHRTCFVYEEQYFELDFFEYNSMLLELELENVNQSYTLPPFLELLDVSENRFYTNEAIAKLAKSGHYGQKAPQGR
jgi:CYTH domain-containing protein/thymidylate kinase